MHKSVFMLILCILAFSGPVAGTAAPLTAKAVVERMDPFLGEPFIFQIQVSGSEHPDRPDLSHVTDFMVAYKGGQQKSRRSVTIINGRVVQEVDEGYFFSYQFTAKKEGRLKIPGITVTANGAATKTGPVVITAKKPVETDDFKVRMNLSKPQCYVAETIILTVTWYIGKDVKDFNFTLPVLEDDRFIFADPEVNQSSNKKYYRIPIGNDMVIGEKGQGRMDGKDYAAITFQKVLIPKRAGDIRIQPATVNCRALMGYKRRKGMFEDDFSSDFFNDDFFGARRGLYKSIVVPSNSLSLQILDLPAAGRPDDFAGHIGNYQIRAEAAPTKINVGDPITLNIFVSGPDYLDHVELPPLSQQRDLAMHFKIPKERATGQVKGHTKVFTQSIRAMNADVQEIPSLRLPYFDPETVTYRIARTRSIPLSVKATRTLTALDAEGRTITETGGNKIETWGQGIAFNYDGMEVLQDQRFGSVSWFRSPVWLCLILGPPFIYLLLLGGVFEARRRNANPVRTKAKKAYGSLRKALKVAKTESAFDRQCVMVQDGFRQYLGDKLGMVRGSLTFNDVKDRLAERGVTPDIRDRLKALFDQCEACRYTGNIGMIDARNVSGTAVQLAKELEKRL